MTTESRSSDGHPTGSRSSCLTTRVRRVPSTGVIVAVLAVLLSGCMVANAGGFPWGDDSGPGCRDQTITVAQGRWAVQNCAAVDAPALAATLARTDALLLGLIRPGDLLLANRQWLVWIDTQSGPGILRGLWPLDAAGGFVGLTDESVATGAAKSNVLIQQGFVSRRAPFGYKGIHVEVWEGPELENWRGPVDQMPVPNRYFTYRNDVGATAPAARSTRHDLAQLTFQTRLVDAAAADPVFRAPDGTAELDWTLGYDIAPATLRIRAEVHATRDISMVGDVGGLLLLFNTGCKPAPNRYDPTRFAACPIEAMRDRTFHLLEAASVGGPGGPIGQMGDIVTNGTQVDYLAPGHEPFLDGDVRSVVQYGPHHDPAFTFRTAPTGGVSMRVAPSWGMLGPSRPGVTAIAYRDYRATPEPIGGFRSLDLSFQPPGPRNGGGTAAPLRIGPTAGAFAFGLDLSH